MPEIEISTLDRVDIRNVWPHEAHDFTKWLTDNIEVLGGAIGIELSNARPEQAAGSFSVDILAEDQDGDQVIIENQYGKSDQDHLGKLLTYATSFGAKTAVWVAGRSF